MLMYRNLTNVYKQSSAPNGLSSLLIDCLYSEGCISWNLTANYCNSHKFRNLNVFQNYHQGDLLYILHVPLWHNPRLWNLTEQLVLRSQMVVDCGSGFSWLSCSQVSKHRFLPSEHQWDAPATWTDICSLNSGNCTVEPTSFCILWKLSQTTKLILFERRCWNMRTSGLGHWCTANVFIFYLYQWKTRRHSHMFCVF